MRKLYTTKATTSNYSAKLILFAILLLLCAYNSYSQVTVPFTPRKAAATPSKTIYTVKGDFSMIGNTNLTLVSYGDNTNNDNDMMYVDVDSDSNTINSSSATLTFSQENGALPECSNIVYAGLYWTGRAGNDETVTVGTKVLDKRKVLIKKGASGTYTPVIANTTSITNKNIYFPSGTQENIYSAYADITSFVQTNKLGEYFVADIATLEGNPDDVGNYGGWGMVVVYENSQMNWRDVTVFDGFAFVKGPQKDNFTFDVSGFNTAQSGNLNIKLGVMAGEGDTGISGDYFQIQRQDNSTFQSLSHSLNSTNNFFNSSINTGGNPRSPNLLNNTGIDIAMFNIDNTNNGIIKNGDTSTRFKYGSTQDTYVIFNVTFSIDAYVPEVIGVIKNTFINGVPNTGNISIEPGQTAEYKLEIKNVGTEATNNTVVTIPLPNTVNPTNLINNLNNFNTYYSTSSDYENPTYNANLGPYGSIVWNLGTLPLPTDPNTILADISFTLITTTDCSLIGGVDPTITLYGSISGTGAISNVSFDTSLIQGYASDDTCKDNPIPIPIVLNIDNTNFVNQPPTITAPSELTIEGCDENNITDSTARYAYSPSQSVDIKNTYVNATEGYTTSNDVTSITYVDAITSNSSCSLVVTRTYTATNSCGNTADAVQTITISPVPLLITNLDGASTVNCIANATETFTLPTIQDACGNTLTPSAAVITDSPDPLTCEGTRTYTYTFTDCAGNTDDWAYTYTIDTPAFSIPDLDGASTVNCIANATETFMLPTIQDACGNTLTPSAAVITDSPDPLTCEGTRTYTYTYTDCAGNTDDWAYTYTIDLTNFILPANGFETVDNLADAVEPTPPTVTDNCGNILIPSAPVVTETPDCQGTIKYTYAYTDCAGNTANWTYTYTIILAPYTLPDDEASTVECISDVVVPTPPTVFDANNNEVIPVMTENADPVCQGDKIYTFTYTDCGGNTDDWIYTYTINDDIAPVAPAAPSDMTYQCIDDVPVAGNLTAVDNCAGNITVAGVDNIDNSNPCNIIIKRTWTFTDNCDNTSSVIQTITVKDTIAPELTNNLDTEMDVSCADIPDKPNLTFEDNCSSNIDIDYSETNTFDENALTDYEIVRTWIVSDACGNKNTYTQTLHVTLDEVVTEVIGEDKCYDDGIIDLNNYLQVTNINGVWEMIEGNQQATLEGNIFNPTTLELSLDFNPRTDGIPYKFKYTTTDNGCISVTYVSMIIDAKCKVLACSSEDVVVSKAVTPNGDQWNEYFEVGVDILCGFKYDVKIFNRWGALVYESHDYKGNWNGNTAKGSIGSANKVPNGTYYYIIIIKNSNGTVSEGFKPLTGPVYIGTK